MASSDPFNDRYGPWAVIAGASEGLGAAFAQQLAEKGLNLVLAARRADVLDELSNTLRDTCRVEVLPLAVDLADPAALERIADETAGLDVGLLVYNAAYSLIGPFLDQPLADHLKEIDVNCRAPLALSHHFGARMAGRARGGILLLSSMAGFQGSALIANYAATKAYNLVLGEGLWDELRGRGVDVLVCCAGATRTPSYERSRPATPGVIRVPVQEPDAVAREALTALGRRPLLIPGRINRIAASLLHRLMPRRRAVTIMGNSTRSMYEKK